MMTEFISNCYSYIEVIIKSDMMYSLFLVFVSQAILACVIAVLGGLIYRR